MITAAGDVQRHGSASNVTFGKNATRVLSARWSMRVNAGRASAHDEPLRRLFAPALLAAAAETLLDADGV